MPAERIKYLVDKFCRNDITMAEQTALAEWVQAASTDNELREILETAWMQYQASQEIKAFADPVLDRIWSNLFLQTTTPTADLKSATSGLSDSPPVHRVQFLKTAWFRYAAVLLLIAGTATFFYLSSRPQKEIASSQPLQQPDIHAGGNKAILTLSDGSTIVLDSTANGELAKQGNAKILKLNIGTIAYESGLSSTETTYNTVSTPKGGQYQIILADGSKVWLNAASSIRFPTTFVKDRKVTITGEVYMEVAKNKKMPFYVQGDGISIEVLGTSFNINSYSEEAVVKTSLADGLIKVNGKLLHPGQAYMNGKVGTTNIQQDIAWKNEMFNFDGLGVKELMRQIARWYDVEIVYQGTIPDDEFFGEIERNSSLSDLLARLNKTGIKTRLEAGRKLVVLPSE